MSGIWNLWAGTDGFSFPYILRTVGAQSQAASVALQAGGFTVAMLSIGLVFMRFSDRVSQRAMMGMAGLLQVAGMVLLAVFPLTTGVALGYQFLLQFGGGFGQQSFFQLWSGELFPTLLRSTAQGVMFAVVRHRVILAGEMTSESVLSALRDIVLVKGEFGGDTAWRGHWACPLEVAPRYRKL